MAGRDCSVNVFRGCIERNLVEMDQAAPVSGEVLDITLYSFHNRFNRPSVKKGSIHSCRYQKIVLMRIFSYALRPNFIEIGV